MVNDKLISQNFDEAYIVTVERMNNERTRYDILVIGKFDIDGLAESAKLISDWIFEQDADRIERQDEDEPEWYTKIISVREAASFVLRATKEHATQQRNQADAANSGASDNKEL